MPYIEVPLTAIAIALIRSQKPSHTRHRTYAVMPIAHPPNAPVLSQFSLKGKVAAVTGGARGIGIEVVRGLAEAGADVAMLYTTSTRAPQLSEQIAKETGTRVQAYQADVRNVESMDAAMNQIVSDYGRLDIIVANAGITLEKAALDITAEEFRNVMAVNVDGAFYSVQAAGKIFEKQVCLTASALLCLAFDAPRHVQALLNVLF